MMGTDLLDQNCIPAGSSRQGSREMCESNNRCQRRISGATQTPELVPVTAAGQSAGKL